MDGAQACDWYLAALLNMLRWWVGGCNSLWGSLGVNLGGITIAADLGGSSKYSNESFEDWSGEWFHVNIAWTWVSRSWIVGQVCACMLCFVLWKAMGLTFPSWDVDNWWWHNQLWPYRGGSWKAFPFLFYHVAPWNTDCLEQGSCVGKALCLSRCLVCLQLSLKSPMRFFICTPIRTHNRIRSPRLTASGL